MRAGAEARGLPHALHHGRVLSVPSTPDRGGAQRVRQRQARRAVPASRRNQPVQCVPSPDVRARPACLGVRRRGFSSRSRRRAARHPSPPEAEVGLRGLRDRLERMLDSLERLTGRPLGAFVLFVLALAVYAVRAIGWPLIGGRDLDEYLYDYIQFLDWHPLLPWSMLFRTPVTGIIDGAALEVAHGLFAEPLMAVLFAGSVVA